MKKFTQIQNTYSKVAVVLLMVLVVMGFAYNLPGETLVSNVDGKIKVIILHYATWGNGFWFDQTVIFRELLEKMDKDVGFVILLGKDYMTDHVKETLKPYEKQKLPDGTPRVKYLNVEMKSSECYPWARDPYVILTDKDHRLIFLDAGFNTSPFPVTNFHEVFENAITRAAVVHRGGGNIRATDKEIFVGMDTLLGIKIFRRWRRGDRPFETLYSLAGDVKEKGLPIFKEKFEAHCNFMHYALDPGKKMIIPGKELFFEKLKKGEFEFNKKSVRSTGAQAAYHTDVYLSLGHIDKDGKRVLFIADTKAGAAVVEKMSPEERRMVERKLPEILAEEKFTASGIPVTGEQIAQRFRWEEHKLLDLCIKRARELADMPDKMAAHLETLDFHVVRIPYLPNGLDNKDDRHDNNWGIGFNYSNVLTEVYGKNSEIKKVYMPQFGFKQLDDAAAEAYREAGFQVVFIRGLLTNALTNKYANAGLDCLTSEIRFPVRWASKCYGSEGEKVRK
ncbi:MAG: hypothetical protein GTN53_06060 [Candidatus Aminicenantes bacterium]|nr:hypothetical protein [Candidatus Aminicenantes bacterium]NIQ66060.1 hypothetical protein [Candidatus Aminicenantes bacterium]NIT22053.1 hypothetical protein [Candidatus Aminicenantes bacterium]